MKRSPMPCLDAFQHNRLLASLAPPDRALIEPCLSVVEFTGGARIAPGMLVASAWFPLTLVASVAEVFDDGMRFDVGLIGAEGLLGWQMLLGAQHSQHCATVQLAGGAALSLPVDTLSRLCIESRSLHGALLSFVQTFTVQMGRTLAANLRDGIDRRLARWLLMLHDRISGDLLPITHVELAAALHVRRASVTDWLHILEGDHILRCTRGMIEIRDRAALRTLAGDSYGAAEVSYTRLIAPFGKDARAALAA